MRKMFPIRYNPINTSKECSVACMYYHKVIQLLGVRKLGN